MPGNVKSCGHKDLTGEETCTSMGLKLASACYIHRPFWE